MPHPVRPKAYPRSLTLTAVVLSTLGVAHTFAATRQTVRGRSDVLLERFFDAAAKYRQTFRNLVAEETRLFETLSKSGKVERRREVVSDLLVYQSSRSGQRTTAEYRDVQSVDGKAIGKRPERALELLTKASESKSLEKELEAIDRETRRYEFNLHVQGFTTSIWGPAKETLEAFAFEQSPDRIAGRDVVVVTYVQAAALGGFDLKRLPREFGRDPKRVRRGRLWLDPETGQAWRSEWEIAVRHPARGELLTVVHGEATYRPSDFGTPVPARIVFEWRDHFSHPKGGVPSFAVRERITYTYGTFRKFSVTTEEKVGR